MKKSAHLQKLYALLLLAVISISMLPVKLLHRHEEAHFSVPSAHHSQNESFTAGDQAYCPVCLYTFAHH
ncbi:MAG TPA: hypothetical protein VD772_02400, partial [Anseongella sp.]|nr:hypothetical protein [Anseongella sp.]